jgi:hypothetical protein
LSTNVIGSSLLINSSELVILLKSALSRLSEVLATSPEVGDVAYTYVVSQVPIETLSIVDPLALPIAVTPIIELRLLAPIAISLSDS